MLGATIADKRSPIAYGYGDKLAVYFNQAPIFSVAAGGFAGGRGGGGGGGGGGAADEAERRGSGDGEVSRTSGRGRPEEQDIPQGRPLEMASPPRRPGASRRGFHARAKWEAVAAARLRCRPSCGRASWCASRAENELFVSGMLAGGRALANSPAVVDVPRGKGHVLMFANNPMWRNETQGSYFLLFNAMLNYDHLGAGVQAAPAGGRGGRRGGTVRREN